MKQVKFLLEVAGLISVVPVLVFAKVVYTNSLNTLAVQDPAVRKIVPAKWVVEVDQYVNVFPGLINSTFINVNY